MLFVFTRNVVPELPPVSRYYKPSQPNKVNRGPTNLISNSKAAIFMFDVLHERIVLLFQIEVQ